MRRPRRSDGLPALHWDGHALTGDTTARRVVVNLPLRLVSCRSETLPPAEAMAVKAAARLKAERAFAPLGPVAIDALLPPARDGRIEALLLALPRGTLDAIRAAAQARGVVVAAVRVAELAEPVPPGGLVEAGGEAALVALADGQVRALAALGPVAAPGFANAVLRERIRTGIGEDAPGGEAPGLELDFQRPGLSTPPPLLARPGVRLGLLAAGVAAVLVLAGVLHVSDLLAARASARAEADRLRPLAKALAARRADMKEVSGWFEERPALSPALHALATALPGPESADQVRLVRLRQIPGEDGVAEGAAGDRAQMMAFLERVRRDPRIASAEIRSSRSPSKESRAVVFELVFRLAGPGVALAQGASHAAP